MNTPVRFGQLLNGEHFRLHPDGQTFLRDRSGFRTLPGGDNGSWFPASTKDIVIPVDRPTMT